MSARDGAGVSGRIGAGESAAGGQALLDRVRGRLVDAGLAPSAAHVAAALRADGVVLGDAALLEVVASLRSELAGAGVLEPLLADPAVTDVLVNAPDEVWVDRGAGLEPAGVRLRDEAAVRRLAQRLASSAGRRLDEATEAEWSWFFEFNVMAHVRANNVFLPHLRAHGEPAHIMNTSSMAGLLALGPQLVGGFNNGLYTTTKHALIGYCDMLRMELAPEGIGVSVLCPGLVAGNLTATSSRNRPERFGGPMANPREGAPVNPHAMPNEQVGPIVARAIAANRFYIFTHADSSMVEARHRQVLDDFTFLRDA